MRAISSAAQGLSPVRADRNTGVSPAELDIQFIVADRIANLSPAGRSKDTVRRHKGNEACQSQAGCRRRSCSNTDIDIYQEIPCESIRSASTGNVGVKDHDVVKAA